MNEARLGVFQTCSHITSDPEVRILIDRTRNQGRNILFVAKDLRERVRERRCSLHSNKVELANRITISTLSYSLSSFFPLFATPNLPVIETEGCLGLVGCNAASNTNDIMVKGTAK